MRFKGLAIFLASFLLSVSCFAIPQDGEKNTTQKRRVKPNELSLKAGTAIKWHDDLSDALADSKRLGRPIFWYVPSIPGTFMDRSPEINRYMLSGPFSWPAIVSMVNDRFVPLMAIPDEDSPEGLELGVYSFVEPGFVILAPDGKSLLVADRLTTLNPNWLFAQIASTLPKPPRWDDLEFADASPKLAATWKDILEKNWNVPESKIAELQEQKDAESSLLAGMILFMQGRQAEARKQWESTAKAYPDHPLGWKASCEAQGIGPFMRGFEVFGDVPDFKNTARITSGCSERVFSEPEIWRRSSEYLLRMQDESGGYFDSDYDFGGYDSLPNVHVAVTALVGLALMDARSHVDAGTIPQIDQAIERAATFVANDANLNFNDKDEILWAQAYRIRFLAALAKDDRFANAGNALQNSVNQLQSIQMQNGHWYHEYANSFVTATALNALRMAQESGASLDSNKVRSGLKVLERERKSNGAYSYYPSASRGGQDGSQRALEASAGRISICELARRQWGEIDDVALADAVSNSLKYHDLLAKALKYDNHTSTYEYGGFFFWYDMQARSEAIHMIADESVRKPLAKRQHDLILDLPEIDGCFVDSHELGRCYGTAMALISLAYSEENR